MSDLGKFDNPTDKTPSSQEQAYRDVLSFSRQVDPDTPDTIRRENLQAFLTDRILKPHDLEETPTVKEWPDGTPQVNTTWPRDAKKCTCKWDNSGDQRDYQTEPVIIAPDVNCPKHGHGDGAKKETTCICENPNTYSGRNMNCPIHPFKRDAAPQDSLSEILVRVAHDTITHDGAKSAIQDWHITQVREFAQGILEVIDRALERLEDTA